jgi:hypothetical protein
VRERQPATIRYVDRLDIAETFADSITGLVFDGQTLRIEFGVTRVDEVKPDAPITGRRYPASRIVLSPGAAIAHQPHAADRGRPHAGRRGEDDAGARPEAAIELIFHSPYAAETRWPRFARGWNATREDGLQLAAFAAMACCSRRFEIGDEPSIGRVPLVIVLDPQQR